jgi:hypothetical protein
VSARRARHVDSHRCRGEQADVSRVRDTPAVMAAALAEDDAAYAQGLATRASGPRDERPAERQRSNAFDRLFELEMAEPLRWRNSSAVYFIEFDPGPAGEL